MTPLERWNRRAYFAKFVIAAMFLTVAAVLLSTSRAAYESPPCYQNVPQPAWVVELPDGSEIGATRFYAEYQNRRLVLVGDGQRLFCDGLEPTP